MLNGHERLMKSTMTQNQYESDSFFVSDSLKGLIDPASLEASSESSEKLESAGDQVVLQYLDSFSLYPLSAWTQDSLTVVVPVSHLKKLVYVKSDTIKIDLFGNEKTVSHTWAVKKEGEWHVTLFTQGDI